MVSTTAVQELDMTTQPNAATDAEPTEDGKQTSDGEEQAAQSEVDPWDLVDEDDDVVHWTGML